MRDLIFFFLNHCERIFPACPKKKCYKNTKIVQQLEKGDNNSRKEGATPYSPLHTPSSGPKGRKDCLLRGGWPLGDRWHRSHCPLL